MRSSPFYYFMHMYHYYPDWKPGQVPPCPLDNAITPLSGPRVAQYRGVEKPVDRGMGAPVFEKSKDGYSDKWGKS